MELAVILLFAIILACSVVVLVNAPIGAKDRSKKHRDNDHHFI